MVINKLEIALLIKDAIANSGLTCDPKVTLTIDDTDPKLILDVSTETEVVRYLIAISGGVVVKTKRL